MESGRQHFWSLLPEYPPNEPAGPHVQPGRACWRELNNLWRSVPRQGPRWADGPLGETPRAKNEWGRYPSSKLSGPGAQQSQEESGECPKIQALRAGLKQKYGDMFFSGNPVFPPAVLGPYGEAQIRLKPDPRVYPHRDFALKGEGKEAMEKNLREFIGRGQLQPCYSEWAPPCFVVPKKVAGEWQRVVDYRGPNAQMQHDS